MKELKDYSPLLNGVWERFEAQGIQANEQLVFLWLISHAQKFIRKGKYSEYNLPPGVWIGSAAALAQQNSAVSRWTAQRALKALEEHGWIKLHKCDDRRVVVGVHKLPVSVGGKGWRLYDAHAVTDWREPMYLEPGSGAISTEVASEASNTVEVSGANSTSDELIAPVESYKHQTGAISTEELQKAAYSLGATDSYTEEGRRKSKAKAAQSALHPEKQKPPQPNSVAQAAPAVAPTPAQAALAGQPSQREPNIPVTQRSEAPEPTPLFAPAPRLSQRPRAEHAGTSRPQQPSAAPAPVSGPAQAQQRVFTSALDYVFDELAGQVQEESLKRMQRIVFYAWKRNQFWGKQMKAVRNEDHLVKLAKKIEPEVPQDFCVPGSASMFKRVIDPDCATCKGRGTVKYLADIHKNVPGSQFMQSARECECVTFTGKPWQTAA